MPTLHHKHCDLAYRVEGTGPPVLFIQGVGLHGDGWQPQVEALSSQYTCLSFDNRGMAGSQPLGPDKLTMDAMVGDALALAGSLGWQDWHVVGHSMGGHIATALALSAPERVRSLTLMCTSLRGKEMPPLSLSQLWTSVRSLVGTKRQRRRAFMEMVLPRTLRATEDLDEWAQRLALIFGHDLAESPPVLMKQVAAYRTHDARGRANTLRDIPTLVVGAAEDPLSTPVIGRRLAEAIPGSRYHEISDAAHGVTVTHAGEINALLADHFTLAEGTRTPEASR